MAKGAKSFSEAKTCDIPHMIIEHIIALHLRNHIVAKAQNYLLPIQSLDRALGIK